MKNKIKITSLLILALTIGQIPMFSINVHAAVYSWPFGRPQSAMLNVPYTSQVPTGNWNDPRQADGCEEASLVMAMGWINGGAVPPEEAERDIINISEYERRIFGFYQDTSAQDTARLMRDFFLYTDVAVKENINTENIKQEIASNRLVIIPIDPRLTGLAMYRNGPVRHMIVVVGYDDKNDELIINDPLYGNAHNLWVSAAAINKGLRNYDSGIHRSTSNGTALISIGKADILYQ